MLRLRRLNRNQDAVVGIVCIVIFIGMLVFSAFMVWFFTQNIVAIGTGILIIVLSIFLIVVTGILAKRYLFGKGGK